MRKALWAASFPRSRGRRRGALGLILRTGRDANAGRSTERRDGREPAHCGDHEDEHSLRDRFRLTRLLLEEASLGRPIAAEAISRLRAALGNGAAVGS